MCGMCVTQEASIRLKMECAVESWLHEVGERASQRYLAGQASQTARTRKELNGAVNHESLGSRRSNSFRRGNQDSRSMTASEDTSKHVQQTRGSRTSFMLARMQRHVLWLLAAVFLRCQARYQNCSRDDRFSNGAARQSIVAYTTGPVAATIDFRTARQSHVCSRGILSQRRVFRRLLHDARKSLHGSPRLIVGQCLHVGF